jgi:YHS domain-containing protein
MSSEFVRCEYCKIEIPQKACKLAAHKTVIDGKEYTFCCASCATRYIEKRGKNERARKSKDRKS